MDAETKAKIKALLEIGYSPGTIEPCGEPNPTSDVTCQKPKGHRGDSHRSESATAAAMWGYVPLVDGEKPCTGWASAPSCRTGWTTHACALDRGHAGHHLCRCCDCTDHASEHDDNGCVGAFPYYGPELETVFFGEDAREAAGSSK